MLTDWFLPGYKAGGPIQSCANIAFALKEAYEIAVLTTDTDHGEKIPYEAIPSNRWIRNIDDDIAVYYIRKSSLALKQIKTEIENTSADYVHLNHLFSPYFVIYPIWLKYRGRLKSKLIISPRGALYDSALAVKPLKKKVVLQLFKWMQIHKKVRFHATNAREREAIYKYFPGSEVIVADNLPSMHQLPYSSCPKKVGSIKCIFIARIVPIKNLLFALEVLKEVNAEVDFTIIGPVEDKDYWNACAEKISSLPSHIRVDYIGPRQNDELVELLHKHHLFILPTEGENFGHSIFEAFLTGRPVLISDQTPWRNLYSQKTGWDLPLHEKQAFVNSIEEAASWDQARFDEYGANAWKYANDFIHNPQLMVPYYELFS
jgi:glycosyltransferase involved in cell wall biosynthesis